MSRALCWIRRDLRLSDHQALAEACRNFDEVVVVFIFDTTILDVLINRTDSRVTFIVQSLLEIEQNLRERKSRLVVRHGDPKIEIPLVASELNVDAVVTARDWEPYAIERDSSVKTALEAVNIQFFSVKDQVIFEKGEVLSQTNTPFRVFTPFSRRWLELFDSRIHAESADPDLTHLLPESKISVNSFELNCEKFGFESCQPWIPAGEQAAQIALKNFESKIHQYGEARDIPNLDGTSFLSVHLRFGTLSIREAVRAAIRNESAGSKKWLTELIWREFYQDILANSPQVVSTTFDPCYKDFNWSGNLEHFEAWKAGITGYPIVDAAMRCFSETGWMHNRLRMIVASFLTKDLLIDYKLGEKYFAENLLDFDLASNNGGWQWAASVGCDAQPYFRIFNPTLQSLKFDPEGAFIRRWVPELASLDNVAIHDPSLFDREICEYPLPIVDHRVQREKAIALFKQAKENPSL